MTDLMQIISNGAANIKLEITGEDLRVSSSKKVGRFYTVTREKLKDYR